MLLADCAQRAHRHVDALLRIEAADREHDARVGGNVVGRIRAPRGRRRVETVVDRHELAWRNPDAPGLEALERARDRDDA